MHLRLHLLLVSGLLASLLVAQDHNMFQRPTTVLKFAGLEHDFGRIPQGSQNVHVFTFRNTGKAPLIIESAEGSYGCTVPAFPRDPILPGREGAIEVMYKPMHQIGVQQLSVTLTANTLPSRIVLRIKADVIEVFPPITDAMDNEVDYDGPVTTLRFDEYEHDFGRILQGSENPYVFKFKNTGDVPLTITSATGSCGCTVPFYAKDPIMPGEESEIHVVYKPGKQLNQQQKQVTIVANTEPRTTMLRITAEVLEVDEVKAPSIIAVDEEHQKDRAAVVAASPGCFVLFPNPTSNELRLDLKEHIGRSADVRIHDQMGQEVLKTRIADINSETSRLDVASFTAGIYVVTIQVEGGLPMSQCFVVNR